MTVSGDSINYEIINNIDIDSLVTSINTLSSKISKITDFLSALNANFDIFNNFICIAVGILVVWLVYSIFKISLKWFNKFF